MVSVLPDWPGRPPDAEAPEGSGVVIGDGQWIVTAAHVLEGARHIRIRDIDGNVVEAVPGLETPLPIVDGVARMPDGAGLGIGLDWDLIDNATIAEL